MVGAGSEDHPGGFTVPALEPLSPACWSCACWCIGIGTNPPDPPPNAPIGHIIPPCAGTWAIAVTIGYGPGGAVGRGPGGGTGATAVAGAATAEIGALLQSIGSASGGWAVLVLAALVMKGSCSYPGCPSMRALSSRVFSETPSQARMFWSISGMV